MSEYWKSTPKYWCKHCSTYVKDTPFERKQHENTAKHQNNLKRFLRDIQNNHERGEREKERAKSEVQRLKGIAADDTNKSSSYSVSKPTPSVHRPATGPPAIADRKRQWAQLAEMGIKVPEEFCPEVAMAGDWQTLSQQVVDEAPLSTGIKKRRYEGQEDDQEEKEAAGEAVVRRGWGATTKTYPGQDDPDLDDLLSGSIPVKTEKPGSQIKGESGMSMKQETHPALTQDESVAGNHTSPTVEACSDDNPMTPKVVKEEPGATQTALLKDQALEEVSMPVFKRRRPKVS
ncbi:hypothetical protein G647_06275 [Cladophialophora carrionii CBS 160.54]|uniref:Matrin-type domain-containing protein n=1 Tax=Cladophialophora carrionii CBS 160.54 TaxID=1279043 RepID=V9D890_9EURO|nr:uncharacterized protein G647_06275 [Cladophialophora carrionii CBS 160.54]ETI22202.1 hypothetical protein G647_06275 [Cladophialophora carrionii CBS 160.54]